MRLLILLLLTLAGCAKDKAVRPDAPRAPAPVVVEVQVPTYVPIADELLARCAWRVTAPLEEIPSAARERKKCLQFYEANLDAIGTVRGKPVPASP